MVFPQLHIGGRLIAYLSATMAYAALVTFLIQRSDGRWEAGGQVAAAVGVPLGILLVFRNNTANDRWWEARKLWGQLINDCRNLVLKVRAHVPLEDAEFRRFAAHVIAFPEALRLHLRGQHGVRAVPGFEHVDTTFPHSPGYFAELIFRDLNRWNREGKMRETIWVLDVHARSLLDICGACERIRNTPLTASYRALIRWGIALYVVSVPWAIASSMGWWGLPVIAIGAGFFLGMELTAEVVEQPFGHDGDDLPLEVFCRTIRTFVEATVAFTESPEPPPIDFAVATI